MSPAKRARIAFPPSNVTPVWLLAFWRLVRGEADGDYHAAYLALADHLPAGACYPSVEECAAVLVRHRLA